MTKRQVDKEVRKIFQKCLDLNEKGINIDFHFSASTESAEIIKFSSSGIELMQRACTNPNSICFDEQDFKIINDTLDEHFRKVENK
jgi:hypothetical protein